MVLKNYTPKLFKKHVETIIHLVNNNPGIIFLKSWNEWAEGNYMEPDLKWGHGYLYALSDVINYKNCLLT
jgi:hypothetical protein